MREMVDEDEPDMLLLNLFCLSGIGIKVLPRVGESSSKDRGDGDGEEEYFLLREPYPCGAIRMWRDFPGALGGFDCVSVFEKCLPSLLGTSSSSSSSSSFRGWRWVA